MAAALLSRARSGEQAAWDLEDVSLTLDAGEALAILGLNGAGKSTLLKLLAGVLAPGRGRLSTTGRVQSLIELGIQIEHSLSGRENIALACAFSDVSGLEKARTIERAAEISELGEALDHPAHTYSTGMKARLSFATAISLEPEILLVDEVLAVGDFAFQRKCIELIRQFISQGGSLIFVSHDAQQIQAICGRAVLMHHGRMLLAGTTEKVVSKYYELGDSLPAKREALVQGLTPIVRSLQISAPDGSPIRSGSAVELVVEVESGQDLEIRWGVNIFTEMNGINLAGNFTRKQRRLTTGVNRLRCRLPNLILLPGDYRVAVAILDPSTLLPFDEIGWATAGHPFKVQGNGSADENLQRNSNQLVWLNVEWED